MFTPFRYAQVVGNSFFCCSCVCLSYSPIVGWTTDGNTIKKKHWLQLEAPRRAAGEQMKNANTDHFHISCIISYHIQKMWIVSIEITNVAMLDEGLSIILLFVIDMKLRNFLLGRQFCLGYCWFDPLTLLWLEFLFFIFLTFTRKLYFKLIVIAVIKKLWQKVPAKVPHSYSSKRSAGHCYTWLKFLWIWWFSSQFTQSNQYDWFQHFSLHSISSRCWCVWEN